MNQFLREFTEAGNAVFLVYMLTYTCFLFMSVIFGAIESERRFRRNIFHDGLSIDNALNYVPISILVPAYNEETTILDSLHSLLSLDYPLYEIVVVDDGSRDDTSRILIENLKLQKRDRPIHRQVHCAEAKAIYESVDSPVPITLVIKENGGKGDALNMGINLARYPYFLCMDADSLLQPDTLKKLIMPVISDAKVIAVGGMVQAANELIVKNGQLQDFHFPYKLVVLMQMLEYSRTFMAMRMFLDKFNGNLIISGACGLFRKDMVIQVGGYNTATVGEDMELVVRLHAYCRSKKIPYSIVYEPEAVCWSQVPETLRDLKSQRRRWQMGLLQSLAIHRVVLFNPLYGAMGMVSTFYFLLVEALGPLIELAGFGLIILGYFLEMLNFPFMISYFILFYLLNALVSFTSFFTRMYLLKYRMTVWEYFKILAYALTEALVFHHIINYFRLTAMVNYRKYRTQWGSIQRRDHSSYSTKG